MPTLTAIGPTAPSTSNDLLWTAPAGVYFVYAQCIGGGGFGGGGGSTQDQPTGGGGGGGGGYGAGFYFVTPGSVYTLSAGGPLSDSYFGSIIGGFGDNGEDGGDGGNGGVGGVGTGDVTINGQDGLNNTVCIGGNGGKSGNGSVGGLGGISDCVDGSVGTDGSIAGGGGGGGGGGSDSNGDGGAGAPGIATILYYSVYGFRFNSPHGRHDGPSPHGPNPGPPPINSPVGPIPHDVPINKYTVTRGIGMRRKWILGGALAAPPPTPIPIYINKRSCNCVK